MACEHLVGQEKTKKDPDAPKRPAGGAYGVFLAQHRADFAKDCQGQPATAVAKIASAKWTALGEDEKKSYEEEYKVKMEAYQDSILGLHIFARVYIHLIA